MDHSFIIALCGAVLLVIVGVAGATYQLLSLRKRRPVPIPASWQGNPEFAGALAWATIGRRCPELLGVAADRVLGSAVVDYVLKTQKLTDPAEACGDVDSAIASEPEEEPKSSVLAFKDGEPTSLSEYPGQPHITEYLMALVKGTDPDCVVPAEHQLFLGPAGQGKTLLARCFTNELIHRAATLGLEPVQFIRRVASEIENVKQLEDLMRLCMTQPTVLFLDELHGLTGGHTLKLYEFLEEGRYRFEGRSEAVPVRDLVILGATTDYGTLHSAVKRRFNRHFLERLTPAMLLDILLRQQFPILRAAAQAIIDRTHFSGAPWEALELYRQAKVFAKARNSLMVEECDVERVVVAQAIDALGLNRLDRRIVRALLGQPRYRRARGTGEQEFVCYGASESDVVAMAGVDRGEYREAIKPKLMSRGLLQVRPTYGQALTPKAVEQYAQSGRV